MRQSPSRLQTFEACSEKEKLDSKSLLCLDVSTRWNSTYKMLNVAQVYEKAFDRYAVVDNNFSIAMSKGPGHGRPTKSDWINARILIQLLQKFEELTNSVSASHYITSNAYVHNISSCALALKNWCNDANSRIDLRLMSNVMKDKWDKYWRNPEKLNVLMFLGAFFDPRYKMKYVKFVIDAMYDGNKAKSMFDNVNNVLYAVFDEYSYSFSNVGENNNSQTFMGSSSSSYGSSSMRVVE